MFDAIVDRQLFEGAQAIIADRSYRMPDEEMLSALETLLKEQGFLSGILIDESDRVPSSSIFRNRFGSLLRAYALIGYTPERDYSYVEINRALRERHPSTVSGIRSGIERAGGYVEHQSDGLLRVNDEFTISVAITRCVVSGSGSLRWHIRLDTGLFPDITVAIRMATNNSDVLDYYLLPSLDMTSDRLRLSEANGVSLDCYCFETLDYLFEFCQRVSLQEVA